MKSTQSMSKADLAEYVAHLSVERDAAIQENTMLKVQAKKHSDDMSDIASQRDDALNVARNQDLQIEKLNGVIEGIKWGLQFARDQNG